MKLIETAQDFVQLSFDAIELGARCGRRLRPGGGSEQESESGSENRQGSREEARRHQNP
ncbi:MAG: hypothetical protein JOZ05_08785 [Acetobacteraceae bacterium]|nr:hypothetical protein [Acetobacteraceae bacterium]